MQPHFVIAILLLLWMPFSAQAQTWFLNARGPHSPYHIWAFDNDGLPKSMTPTIPPPSKVSDLAWPSAIRVGSTVRVYASAHMDGWTTVRLWISLDGGNFVDQGVVFSANEVESHGIGPTHVMYEPTATEPWTMYYLIRGAKGPGSAIAAATSTDGIDWTRRGTVISANLPEEIGGLSISYACRRASGAYVLVYHGYSSDLMNGVALIAQASGATQLFSEKKVLKTFDSFDTTLTATAGQNIGFVSAIARVPLGIPLLVKSGSTREVVVARRQDDTAIWFDRPLLNSYVSADLLSMARSKVDLSFVRELADGAWTGIFTLYGPGADIAAEYTTTGTASSLSETWTFAGDGLRFEPWLPGTEYSVENPTPLVQDASCSN